MNRESAPCGLLHPGQHNLVGADDFWYSGILGTGRVRERYALAVVRMQHLHVVRINPQPTALQAPFRWRWLSHVPFMIWQSSARGL